MAINKTTFLEQLRGIDDETQGKALWGSFKQIPLEKRQPFKSQLIEILHDNQAGSIVRSWVPVFLSSIGTPNAQQALIEQLQVEETDLVRRWIGRSLARSFDDEKTVEALSQQFDLERTDLNRRFFGGSLAKLRTPTVIPKLIKLLDDEDGDIRRYVAWALGEMKAKETAVPLTKRLEKEKSLIVSLSIIEEGLVPIGDSQVVPKLVEILKNKNNLPQLQIAILQAFEHLASPDDTVVTQTLLEVSCSSNRVVALTATDTLLNLLKTEAAKHLAKYGLQQEDPEKLSRVADALRLAGGTEAINYLKMVKGDFDQENRAQTLLEEIGGSQAVGALVDRRVAALGQAGERVKDFDDQGLRIFTETVDQAKKGFTVSLLMSGTIFIVGVILLGVSIYIMIQPEPTLSQQFFGVGGGIAGLTSILAMFYKGPMDRIEQSVANLVQTEIAFLGYIRQVTQINAMFEREYLGNEEFKLAELKEILEYTNETMEKTMPLVSKYTAVSSSKTKMKEVFIPKPKPNNPLAHELESSAVIEGSKPEK